MTLPFRILAVLAVAPIAIAAAQTPPVPPTTPVTPVTPVVPAPRAEPAARPAPIARTPLPPDIPLLLDGHLDAVRMVEEARHLIDVDAIRHEALLAADHARALAPEMDRMALDMSRMELAWGPTPRVATTLGAPSARYQGDPADSLYQLARRAFERQEYRVAAEQMAAVRSRYPSTSYFCAAAYYESFSRYRLNQGDDLATARRVLDTVAERCAGSRDGRDLPALRARVVSALADRGDRDAVEEVRRLASSGARICDSEKISVRAEALSAIMRMDPAAGKDAIRTTLRNRDECSRELRRQAVSLLSRSQDAEAVSILVDVARNDPDRDVQYIAVSQLGALSTDPAFAAIEEFLRTASDERLQQAAASALARSENPRALSAVRALIDRKDVAEKIRVSAITSLGDRERARTMGDYFRTLYGRVESDELRIAVVNSLGRGLTEENQQFLLGIARDRNQPSSVRAAALTRVRGSVSTADLYRIYETADTRSMRTSVVSAIALRGDSEAVDRLIDIVKTSTDPEVRNSVIRQFANERYKDNPKVKQTLRDLLGG